MPLLEVKNVSKTYRQGGRWHTGNTVQALADISLNIHAGQCLAVVGPSGSGKSTLGRLILGLEQPDTGTVLYKGSPYRELLKTKKQTARRAVQAVFQNSHGAVNPRFSVKEIIAEPLRYCEEMSEDAREQRVRRLLEDVGLPASMLARLPHQCSGGELQRVCIARALALSPELIVLDEAVSSLDLLNQHVIVELLNAIRREKKTAFVFISHDLRVVSRIADALAILQNGQLEFYSDNLHSPEQQHQLMACEAFQQLERALLPCAPERQ